MKISASKLQSPFQATVCAMGSARVAVMELLALALGCAAGSFRKEGMEALGINSSWMVGVVILVIATLVCATSKRWPWRLRDAGFIATHYGIVLLLAGGMIERWYGLETRLRLHTSETINESQMVFAKDDSIVVQRGKSAPSGVKIGLYLVQGEPAVTMENLSGVHESMPLSSVLGKAFTWRNEPQMEIRFRKYWPAFSMSPAGPISRSEKPNNPAVLVELTSNAVSQTEAIPGTGMQVQLLRFEVDRDVESSTPVDFRSTIRLSGAVAKTPLETTVSVNHPVAYPPGFWRTALGLNTRFLQVGWNPADLRESTLEVRREPGWPFLWSGSVLFCCGLIGHYFCLKSS
jgi:cytochrome c biogenesis protein ResB